MKFLDILFCDDIRTEINNKVSLMGLYNDRIVFHRQGVDKIEWPVKFKLSALVRLNLGKNDSQLINFDFAYTLDEEPIVSLNGQTELPGLTNSIFSLVLIGSGLQLRPGRLGYSLKIHSHSSGDELLNTSNKNALKIIESQLE